MQADSAGAPTTGSGLSMVGSTREDVGRLVLACPDRPAILAAVVSRLAAAGTNIITFDQFSTGPEGGRVYLRSEFLLKDLPDRLDDVRSRIEEIAEDFDMQWRRARDEAKARGHLRVALRALPARPAVALAAR
jgi:formyltetrahydrofolate hydrolase